MIQDVLFWPEKPPVQNRDRSGAKRTAILRPEPVAPVTVPFTRPDDWAPPDIGALPELSGIVALDFETKDPGISEGRGSSWAIKDEGFITGAAIASEQGAFYLPIDHSDGNLDKDRMWQWLAYQAKKPDVTFVMAHSMYDTGWLHRQGHGVANAPYDVQAMAALLNEHRNSYSLDNLGLAYLNERKLTAELVERAKQGGVLNPMGNMDKLPAWIVEPYALKDADLTLRLFHHLRPMMEEQDLINILNLERECALVAVDMRARGVRVNLERADLVKREFILRRDLAIDHIKSLTGVAVAPFDNVEIARALRTENPDVQLERTTTGRDSIRAHVLEALDTPVARSVREMRKMEKAISTFFEGYLFKHTIKGRIHAEFHPLRRVDEDGARGTISGRFSSSNPNLQNIPERDLDIKKAIKGCFEPEEDEVWVKLDYSSQEPRLTVHFAYLARQPGAAAMVERYRSNPTTDLHDETGQLMGQPRSRGKTINLGIAYGLGGAGLCHQLGLPTKWIETRSGRRVEVAGDEGQRLLDAHRQAVPFIPGLYKLTKDTAESRGYIKTILGRHCHFIKADDGTYLYTHAACNRLVQGSAADQMKQAMVLMRREGIPLMIVVHDESDFSAPKGEAGERMIAKCKEIMEQAVPLVIPVIADVKTGETWAEVE